MPQGSRRAAYERRRRGTAGNPDPAERRRPVAVRSFGGKHVQCLDVGKHVPATSKGSGTSATRTRRTVPCAGSPDRCTGLGPRLLPPSTRIGGGRGRGRQGETT